MLHQLIWKGLKHCADLQEEVLALKESKRALSFGTEECFNSNEKVQYYTALPTIEVLRVAHEFCLEIIDFNVNCVLSTYPDLVLTLCRLRLNFINVWDEAYIFEISVPIVSKVFHRWLDVLFSRLGKLNRWPERDNYLKLHHCSSEMSLEPK